MYTASKVLDDAPTLDIVETVVAAGNLTVLSNAFKAAGLVEAFKGTGPFTLFAPTDAAFRKLPAGTMNVLLKDKARLASILSYHVLRGKVMVKDVKSGDAKTIQGENLKVVVSRDGVAINNAKTMRTDIEASNGVVHSIDTVLMPA